MANIDIFISIDASQYIELVYITTHNSVCVVKYSYFGFRIEKCAFAGTKKASQTFTCSYVPQ